MLGWATTVIGSPGLYVLGVHPLEVMTPIAEASTVHIPTVDRSAAPAPTLTTMWRWGFCHRYSATIPRYVMFVPMSNIAREWWASIGAAARAIPTATARASNGRRVREPAPTIRKILAWDSTLADTKVLLNTNCSGPRESPHPLQSDRLPHSLVYGEITEV